MKITYPHFSLSLHSLSPHTYPYTYAHTQKMKKKLIEISYGDKTFNSLREIKIKGKFYI